MTSFRLVPIGGLSILATMVLVAACDQGGEFKAGFGPPTMSSRQWENNPTKRLASAWLRLRRESIDGKASDLRFECVLRLDDLLPFGKVAQKLF